MIALLSLAALLVSFSFHDGQGTSLHDTGVDQCIEWANGQELYGPGKTHRIGPDLLCFTGGIDHDSAKAFVTRLEDISTDTPLTVVVRSGGGAAGAGLTMGEALARHDATVVVDALCASSCANYLFLSAERRVVLQDGIVVFHGGATMKIWPEMERQLRALIEERDGTDFIADEPAEQALVRIRAELESSVKRQSAFLRAMNLDPDFFEWFNDVPDDVWLQRCEAAVEDEVVVFSKNSLLQRGITLASYAGPESQAELDEILAGMRRQGEACFW